MARAAINRRKTRVGIVLGFAILAGACARTTAFNRSDEFTPRSPTPRVLLMPADIELSEVSAGGIGFPKAEWTKAAIAHIAVALDDFMGSRRAELVAYSAPPENTPLARRHDQLIRLHGAVGSAVLAHKFDPARSLPTVGDRFDYTLGEGVRDLNGGGGSPAADYALFITIRDSYASGERAAVMMFGLLLGAVLPGGVQVGFASLVDLETGDIVWFNRLISQTGDLRMPEPAKKTIENLLADFPL